VKPLPRLHLVNRLKRNTDRNSGVGRIPAVVEVIAVVGVVDVNVVVVVPVIPPVFRPRINRTDPITLVLKARVSADNQKGKAVDSKPMIWPKVASEPVVRDAVTVVAATLAPGAVVRIPAL
jgi:hypothetical protein